MVISHPRPLKVSTAEGERIVAKITSFPMKGTVRIEVPFLEEVKRDAPPFSKDGIIIMTCERKVYMETIYKVTKYLEDLFLKGMADEDIDSSTGPQSESRRIKKNDIERANGKIERKRDSPSVHSSSRRDKSTKSTRGRKSDSKVATGDDSKTERKD